MSLFGGIQPGIFRRAFTGDDGIYLEDGTIFRFLLTYEPSAYHELTLEPWDDTARQTWEMILHRAIRWASNRIAEQSSPLTMILDRDSQDLFVHWRNSLEQRKGKMPESFRGFFPKAYSYALRLAGMLHCLERFHEGLEPSRILGKSDITRGIETIEFYLGQTVSAMKLLESADFTAEQNGPQVVRLAQVLDSLRTDVDSGRLAIGFIQERFNDGLPEEQRIKTPRAMGVLLRSLGLTIPYGHHDANGRQRVSCLLWDTKTESLIKTRLECLGSLVS